MDAKEFVESLKSECRDAAVTGCVEDFTSPPGRHPDPELVELSQWFASLSEKDREMVVRVMSEAADATLFGVLCVLDGVRAIEGAGTKSTFHLTAIKNNQESSICPGPIFLHDL